MAFDSPSLYGHDPVERLDIFGKVCESGVSISTVDEMEKLFEGFDLCAPNTSVSKTINGNYWWHLAAFFTVAIRQQVAKFVEQNGREPTDDELVSLNCAPHSAKCTSPDFDSLIVGRLPAVLFHELGHLLADGHGEEGG